MKLRDENNGDNNLVDDSQLSDNWQRQPRMHHLANSTKLMDTA